MNDSANLSRPWQRKVRRNVLDVGAFRVDCDRLVSPRTGQEHDFFLLDLQDWVIVVPITSGGEAILVRQRRHGTGELTLEAPGGVIDPEDATPEEAARRELREETGCTAERVVRVGVISPNPAMQTNKCHVFLATGIQQEDQQRLDEAEEIQVVRIPLSDLAQRIAHCEVSNAVVLAALTLVLGVSESLRLPSSIARRGASGGRGKRRSFKTEGLYRAGRA